MAVCCMLQLSREAVSGKLGVEELHQWVQAKGFTRAQTAAAGSETDTDTEAGGWWQPVRCCKQMQLLCSAAGIGSAAWALV